jgi:hypothetical protein
MTDQNPGHVKAVLACAACIEQGLVPYEIDGSTIDLNTPREVRRHFERHHLVEDASGRIVHLEYDGPRGNIFTLGDS